MKGTLTDFTRKVNALAQARVERIRRDPKRLFGASNHAPYPERMLANYHAKGYTPKQAEAELLTNL